MRRRLSALLIATFALSACDGALLSPAAVTKRTTKTTSRNAEPSERPTAKPTAAPTAEPTATPTAKPTPKVPMTILSGIARIDAHYVIAAGAGNVISAGSGNVISAGAGNVISAGAGNVISAGAGNVISAGAGNVISAGSGNFRLFDVAEVPVGTIMPVKGLMVVPVSLVTRKQIGEAVLTREDGSFECAIPEEVLASEAANIRFYAAIPAPDAESPLLDDPRLRYDLVVEQADTGDRQLDEDHALATQFIRSSFRSKFAFFIARDGLGIGDNLGWVPPLYKPLVDQIDADLTAAITAAQVPESRLTELAQHLADVMLANMDTEAIENQPSLSLNARARFTEGLFDDPAILGKVMPKIVSAVKQMREGATTRMQADAAFFAAQTYVTEANTGRSTPYQFLKPSDVCAFSVEEYMGGDLAVYMKMKPLWDHLGLSELLMADVYVAGCSIGMAMAQTYLRPEVQKQVMDTIKLYGATAP